MLKNYLLALLFISLGISASSQSDNAEVLFQKADIARDSSYFVADSLIKKAIELIEKSDLEAAHYKYYYLAAKIQRNEGFFDEAQVYFEKAIKQATLQESIEQAMSYKIRQADNYLDMGDFSKAVELDLKVEEQARQLNDNITLAKVYGSLAEIYRRYDYLDLALKYNRLTLKEAQVIGDEDMIARSYNNLSATLGEVGSNQEAIDTLQKALSIISEENRFAKAKLSSNIGYCYRNMGKFNKALEYHRISLGLKKQANMNSSQGYSLGSIGRAHLGLNNYDSAIYYIQLELEHAIRFKNPHSIIDATAHLADAYAENKDFEKAYEYLLKKKELSDSLYEIETEQKVLLYQRKFDLAVKEKEIERLKNEQLLNESAQENKILLLTGLFILACFIAVLFRNRSIKKQQEKELIEVRLKNSQEQIVKDKKALSDFTKDLMAKNKSIKNLSEQLQKKEFKINELQNSKSKELEQLSELKILTEEDWRRFKLLFEKVHPNFFVKLNSSEVNFTKGEKRLAALTKLDMENGEIADTLGISSESVSKSRSRLKKKLEQHNFYSLKELLNEL